MHLAILSPGNVFLQLALYPLRRLTGTGPEVAPSGKSQAPLSCTQCRMMDLQAPEIATKPGTEEQARTKWEWEGKVRLDSGRQCKPEPRRNFSWGGGS